MYILGIWDGHDSGAAITKDNEILVAINEERLTRRKLEIKFPYKSIEACLNYLKIKHSDISEIAVSTSDPAIAVKKNTGILDHSLSDFIVLQISYPLKSGKIMSNRISLGIDCPISSSPFDPLTTPLHLNPLLSK